MVRPKQQNFHDRTFKNIELSNKEHLRVLEQKYQIREHSVVSMAIDTIYMFDYKNNTLCGHVQM